MGWLLLVIAGLLEIGFTTMMKLSHGFTHVWPTLGFLFFAILSFVVLNRALSAGIPLGTAYAVWTGIGACGTAVVGMIFFGDPISAARIILLCTLVGSVIGLKMVSAH
ncbi:small multidrug resistance protein [Pirellula staleyi DSM 6068]|uniref:Guanidinium exporter n=1 Tax=Pirellula staleyi (strain ATCC 27377 / DSM 6068 / ICPB 4128) TaxID=530564 RepID=D2QXU1_PIRSD|nr:multidrug efflux SMR transporter [Pirellula staleyi]ADB18018.1 small multidrug resistance protein [Pirellula staleyi DSM 6068]